jgi:GxxExxY protein
MPSLMHYGLTDAVIGAAMKVHQHLGPGLLESAYQRCLAYTLRQQRHHVAEQVPLRLEYEQLEIEGAYRIDMVVDEVLLLELKAVEKLGPIHIAQAITYLKFSRLEAGLILNFNSIVLRDGLRRVFHNKNSR